MVAMEIYLTTNYRMWFSTSAIHNGSNGGISAVQIIECSSVPVQFTMVLMGVYLTYKL